MLLRTITLKGMQLLTVLRTGKISVLTSFYFSFIHFKYPMPNESWYGLMKEKGKKRSHYTFLTFSYSLLMVKKVCNWMPQPTCFVFEFWMHQVWAVDMGYMISLMFTFGLIMCFLSPCVQSISDFLLD